MDTRYHMADLIKQIRNKSVYLYKYIFIFCFISNKFGRPDLALFKSQEMSLRMFCTDSRIKPSCSF